MSEFFVPANSGIGFPAPLRNQSSVSPIINLHHNATTGIGFFTSVGTSSEEDADTNVGPNDAAKYLINLPLLKRSPGYIAVVMEVTSAEATERDNFTLSNEPGVYIYTGTYPAGTLTIPTSDWRDNNNWMQIQGTSGSGTIDIDIDTVDAHNNISSIDFISATNRTSITSQSTNQIKIDVASDFAGPSQNFYIGGIGQAFEDGDAISTASSGVSIQSGGRIESRVGSNSTVIDGDDISTATISATGNISTSSGTIFSGDQNGTHSLMNQNEVRTATARVTSLVATNVVGDEANYIQFRLEGIPGAFIKLTENATSYEPPTISNDGQGNEAFVHFNSNIRFHNIDSLPDEVSYFYAEGSNGHLIKMPSASVLSGGTDISGGFGINVNASDQISIDTADVVTVNTNQNITARKGIGRVTITGDLGSAGSTQKSFVFSPNSISDVASSTYYDNAGSDKLKLLYMVDNDLVNENSGAGQVFKGVSGSYFLSKYLQFPESSFVITHNTDEDRFKINLRDVVLRNDRHDASMYKVRSRRLGAHSFTPGQINADLTAHGSTSAQITNVQTEVEDGATIIEWVREGGNYNNPSNGDEALRRNAGVIMKSGFTAESDPYDSAGILATKFRFSAKEAGEDEAVTGDEELGGTLSYGTAASSYYGTADGASEFAIQIGTRATNFGTSGDRLNEVTIPNLVVKNLAVDATSDGGIYIDSGSTTGQFGGNWSFGGNVTINGVLTATSSENNLGGGSVSTLSTTASLLELGAVATDGADIAERDIGIVALFNYDGDDSGVPEDDEAMATTFFRDSSETGIANIFGRSASAIGGTDNHHRPWKLMTSSEKVDALTTSVNVADDFHPTGLLVGGLKLQGYDTGLTGGENHLYTGYVNRIINTIPVATVFEGNQNDAWWGAGTAGQGALATVDAIISYVTGTVNGFGEYEPGELSNSTSDAVQFVDFVGANGYTNLFKFGIANDSEVANDDNAYSVGTSWGIIVQQQANSVSTVHKRAQPEEIGLALYQNSTQTIAGQTRPSVGWLPGTAQLNRGTSVRHIMNKIFTAFSFPTISEFDFGAANLGPGYNTIKDFVAADHRILTNPNGASSLIMENGYNDYGFAAGTDDDDNYAGINGVRIKLDDAAGIDELNLVTTLTNVSVTKEDGNPVTAFATDLTTHYADATAISNSSLVVSSTDSGDDKIIYMDFAASANGIGDDAGEVDLTSTQREGEIRYQATIGGLTDSSYDSELPYTNSNKLITHQVRRRSFMFVSNLNIRASFKVGGGTVGFTGTDLDFNVPAGNFVNMNGDTTATDPADGTGHSSRFMHYLLCKAANSGVGSVLGSGDTLQAFGGSNMSFNAAQYGLKGYTGAGTASANPAGDITEVKIRHAVSLPNGTELLNSERRPHGTNSTDLQRYPGYLASYKGALGDSQRWLKSTLGTSVDGFLYRAIPKVMAFNSTSDSDWVVGGVPRWKVQIPNIPEIEELVLDSNGDLVTFTLTNQYGVDTEYVLFQSEQSLEGTQYDSGSTQVQEFGKIVLV
jgi:hypothetical protein